MKILVDFKLLKKNKEDLQRELGEDLFNIELEKPCMVYKNDLIAILEKYINGEINQKALLNWVNVIWFTDLYEYYNKDENSIISVMSHLEELDEEGIDYTCEQMRKMIDCLSKNIEFIL